MAIRAADFPSRTPPPVPLSLDEFAALCLNAVLARARDDARRRENGMAQRRRTAARRKAQV